MGLRSVLCLSLLVAFACAGTSVRAQQLTLQAPADATAPSLPAWTVQLNSEVRYFDLSGTRGDPAVTPAGQPSRGGHATEVYTPTTLSVSGMINTDFRLDGLIRGGYVGAHQSTPGLTGSAGTPTDTVPSLTLTYLGMDGVQPFVSLNMNLPSGETTLFGTSANARLDPDLVDVPTFGEGFNIGPTVGANIPLNQDVVLTLSGGYTARGDFKQEGVFFPGFPQTTVKVHPGDLGTVSGSVTGQFGKLSLQSALSYVHSGAIKNDNVDQLETGEQVSLSNIVGYAFDDAWGARAVTSFAYTFNSRVQSLPFGILKPEPRDSNGYVTSIRLEPTYKIDRFTIGPIGAFQYRNHNQYDSATIEFIPAKMRESAGGQATYAVTDKATLNARLERIWTQLDPTMALGMPTIARHAFIGVVGGTVTF